LQVNFFSRGENSCQIVDDETGVLFVHYPDGRSTGDAFVMVKDDDVANKILLKHKEMMGSRYIELFRSTSGIKYFKIVLFCIYFFIFEL
jgi:epithelial splicing regulatory protein 1/2